MYQLSRKNTLFSVAAFAVAQVIAAACFRWYLIQAIPYGPNNPEGGEVETFYELIHLSDLSIMCWAGLLALAAISVIFFARGTKLVSAISLLLIVPGTIWFSMLWLSRDTVF